MSFAFLLIVGLGVFISCIIYNINHTTDNEIELPKRRTVIFVPKKNLRANARDRNYLWVLTDELKPTGNVLIGKDGHKWLEVRRKFAIGYIPEIILKI